MIGKRLSDALEITGLNLKSFVMYEIVLVLFFMSGLLFYLYYCNTVFLLCLVKYALEQDEYGGIA